MQNLKDHFNQRARQLRKREEKRQKRTTNFILFCLTLLFLARLQDEARRTNDWLFGPRKPPD